jgi:predicted secreted hydrolase
MLCLFTACADETSHRPARPALGVAAVLGEADAALAGYERAVAAPDLQFPRDHGPHPGFRTEWWYVTGNVATPAGRAFGVQLVFFRHSLAPPGVALPAVSLAAREVVLAHAAITDVQERRFHHDERLARLDGVQSMLHGPAAGRAFRIAVADWSATGAVDGDGFLPLDLRAAGPEFAFELRAEPGKPIVLQGDNGLSQKSGEAGNASIYYSLTRLPLRGRIEVGNQQHEVAGLGWIDREWSTSALGPQQVGWDWFSLQLESGEELMWYQLRQRDGAVDPFSRGCWVARDGSSLPLLPTAVTATPVGRWRAADGAAEYPAGWRLLVDGLGLDLEVVPVLPDQELQVLVRYWEGAVEVRGTRAGAPLRGRGYLEMTGYGR